MKKTPETCCDILIVEDEPIVAQDLAYIMEDLGHSVVGPCRSVAEATKLVQGALPDLAFLDVNLADGPVFPLADLLHERGVAIIFCSAHMGASDLTGRYPGALAVSKPYDETAVHAAVSGALFPAAL